MKRVGILVGREKSFPESLIQRINERGGGEVVAEFVEVGGVRHDGEKRYDLIIDRISHEVPFYRGFLKRAALEGTVVINNPFWWSADDKFFNYSLAAKLGVATPRTVLLPQKDYIDGITSESLRNLEFPLDWQDIVDYVGFPAIIKPFDGGGWKNVSRVDTLEELWRVYDTTGTLCMTLQEFIAFDQFVRCYCIGQEEVMIMPYDPRKPYLSGEQYINDPNYLSAELAARIREDVLTLNRALGYDLNTVEFAIKDGVPYAIDFMNPAPDAERISVGEFYHNWVTEAVTNLVFKRLEEPRPAPRYRWEALLNPVPSQAGTPAEALLAVASAAEQAARTIIPQPVREIPGDIASGVSELISDAADAVSGLVGNVVGADADAPQATAKRTRSAGTKSDAKPATKKTGTKAATPRAKKPSPEI
ncbi:MAG: ATP-grasp domain-containing protein [Pyrinomonadaceae bacterium]